MTSHDVVDVVRRQTGERTVGHAGTLDPFATGLLIVGVGRQATKRLSEFLKMDKEYEAVVRLGATSDTDDRTGRISIPPPPGGRNKVRVRDDNTPSPNPSPQGRGIDKVGMDEIKEALKNCLGTIQQLPPIYSAKKVGGRKMYELARAGKDVPRKPATVTIHALDVLDYDWPLLRLRVRCSSGTYIRALARDIGEALGVGGLLDELRRTAIGPYRVKQISPFGKGAHRISPLG